MQISGNFQMPGQSFYHVGGINQGLDKKDTAVNQAANGKRQDRVTVSAQGKMMSAIENLIKQKDAIQERRSELVAKNMESGGDYDTIKEQMELFDEQLENIDKQIAQMTADQLKKATEKEEEKKPKKEDETKTAEQLETEKLSNFASAAESMKHAEAVSSIRNKAEGEARVEKAEIKIAEIDIDRLESKGKDGYTNVAAMVKNAKDGLKIKQDHLADTMEKVQELDLNLGGKIGEAVGEMEEGRQTADAKDTEKDKETESASGETAVSKDEPFAEQIDETINADKDR